MITVLLIVLTLAVPPALYGLNRIVELLVEIRDELRLMRTNGISFDPPRRGR